jgi:hypothetical protein
MNPYRKKYRTGGPTGEVNPYTGLSYGYEAPEVEHDTPIGLDGLSYAGDLASVGTGVASMFGNGAARKTSPKEDFSAQVTPVATQVLTTAIPAAGPYAAAFGAINDMGKAFTAATSEEVTRDGEKTSRATSPGMASVHAAIKPHHEYDLETIYGWGDSTKSGEDQARDTVLMATGMSMPYHMIADAIGQDEEDMPTKRKIVGGSSGLDGRTYLRGNRVDTIARYGGRMENGGEVKDPPLGRNKEWEKRKSDAKNLAVGSEQQMDSYNKLNPKERALMDIAIRSRTGFSPQNIKFPPNIPSSKDGTRDSSEAMRGLYSGAQMDPFVGNRTVADQAFDGIAEYNRLTTYAGNRSSLGNYNGRPNRPYTEYATGGMVPQVSAELEGGETVESPQGDQMVTGPSHEQGGVPMALNEGDYVWSDRIEYKGKSMAEWYELFKKNGAGEEQIEELRMLQERLAGRSPGEQGGEKMALGGEPPKTKFGQWFDRAFGFERRRDMKSRQNAPMAASREVQRRDMEAQGLTPSERQANVDQEQAELMPVMQERLRQSARGEAPQYNPAEAYNKKVDESRAPKRESMGAVPRWKQIATEAAPYAIAGTGALAQIIAAASAKNPYEDVALPKAHQAGFTPVSLSRVSDEADKAATARDYIAQLRAQERSGFGPSGSGRAQSLFNAKQMADAQTTMRTAAANADIDAKEKLGNMDARTRVDMFNAGQRQQVGLAGTELQVGKNSFDSQRGMYIGDAVAGMARDALGYMSARNHAKAIYGNSGVDNRSREYSLDQAYRKIMADNPNMSPNEAWKKAQEDQTGYFSQKKS